MGYNIGPKIGIEGEKEFRDSIKRINDTYKTLEAETRAVTSAFEANGDEQGKLEATAKQLEKQIDVQKEKMSLLQDAVKKASDKYGENSVEATRLRGAMYDAQAGVAKLEAELRDTNSRLDKSEDAMEDFGDAVDDAGDKAISFGDILKANVISDVIMDGLRELGDCVKDFVGGSIEEAAGMQAVTAQVEQTFGAMGDVADKKLTEISEDVNIAGSRMQQAFTKIYAFAKTSDASAENALTISGRAMTVAADSAAYYDRSIEEATETLQAFLKGNFANDAALGISCTETTRNTKANELYAKSYKELSESQKVDVLLAMVEAGNEASGAMGQAAREADGWENVTGELAEVMRLLQVEAGKPALKKLVPIIKNITDAGYELIEDIDWDDFANKVENLADGVIEYGPGVVKAIAAVAAGLVAMKAVQKAEEFAQVANQLLNIGTAATSAVTPWGAAAVAIGAAVALITTYALQADTDAQKLSKAMDTFQDKMEDANEDYSAAKTEIEGTAHAADYYVDRLKELEEAGLDTAVAHKEYELIVEQLNELIPELNLTIDEQTGLINKNVDSLKADIKAWKENATQQALQERFTDVLKARGKAEASLLEAKVKMNQLTEEGTRLNQEFTEAMNEADAAAEAVVEAQRELANATIKGEEAYNEALTKLREMEYAQVEANAALQKATEEVQQNYYATEELSKEVEKAEKTLESYSEDIKLAEEMAALYADETENVTDAQVDLQLKIEDVQNALDSLETAYADALAAAHETVSKQIDLFGDLVEESDYSAEKVIENWQKQRDAMLNYAENLQKASDMGLSKDLIAKLSDGSEQSMAILQQWTSGTEEEIQEINAAFDSLIDGETVVARTIAEINYGFEQQFAAIEKTAEESGLRIVDGIVVGVDKGSVNIDNAMGRAAERALYAFDRKLLIKSPAKAMIPSGRHTVEGVAVGVDENIKLLESSMENLAVTGQKAFDQKQLDRAAYYPAQVTTAGGVQQSRVDHNYGGINIQIYPQEGQDPDQIADVVFDRLQTAVEKKEAAWN